MAGSCRPPDDAPGKFYVTGECIGCGLCVACAPDNLTWDDAGKRCYVIRQPSDVLELEAVSVAVVDCPAACLRREGDANERAVATGGRPR